MSTVQDLWGFKDDPVPEIETPAAILKDQADWFSVAMQNKGVYAELQQRDIVDQKSLAFALDLVVPRLNDYRLRVVSITFGVAKSYPVRVTTEFADQASRSGEVESQDAFVERLTLILRSPQLRHAIASLVANSAL